MEIKDYLHLYMGCEVKAFFEQTEQVETGYLTGIHGEYGPEIQFIIDGNAEESPEYVDYDKVKPVLRKLSDMTEEEKEKLFDHLWPNGLWGIAWSGKIDVIDHILDLQDHWSDLGERVQNIITIKVMSAMLSWLRENSFDADDLIPAGLAIDKTSLKN